MVHKIKRIHHSASEKESKSLHRILRIALVIFGQIFDFERHSGVSKNILHSLRMGVTGDIESISHTIAGNRFDDMHRGLFSCEIKIAALLLIRPESDRK